MAYNPNNPNGQTTMANSSPVVIASDQSRLLAQISDGTSNIPIDASHDDGETNIENHIDIGSKTMVFNGSTWDRQRGDTTGTFMVGNIAHDTADSGNPVKIGFQTETTIPTAVQNGDRVNGIADEFGRQLVTHISPGMQVWKAGLYQTAQTGTSIWTPSTGKKIALTYIALSSTSSTSGRVILWFGASGDTVYTPGTDQVAFVGSFSPSATTKPGAIIQPSTSIFSVNSDYQLRITTDAAINIDVTVYGYEF